MQEKTGTDPDGARSDFAETKRVTFSACPNAEGGLKYDGVRLGGAVVMIFTKGWALKSQGSADLMNYLC